MAQQPDKPVNSTTTALVLSVTLINETLQLAQLAHPVVTVSSQYPILGPMNFPQTTFNLVRGALSPVLR